MKQFTMSMYLSEADLYKDKAQYYEHLCDAMKETRKEMEEELEYLRFFRSKACEMYSEGGTDEAYWWDEAYQEETGKEPPHFEQGN